LYFPPGNYLTHLPDTLCHLLNLTQLVAPRNALRELPHATASMRALRELDVAGNELTKLPPHLGGLRLRVLDVADNRIIHVAADAEQLVVGGCLFVCLFERLFVCPFV
jgi:Leucine-rich repeat (LRR) protein